MLMSVSLFPPGPHRYIVELEVGVAGANTTYIYVLTLSWQSKGAGAPSACAIEASRCDCVGGHATKILLSVVRACVIPAGCHAGRHVGARLSRRGTGAAAPGERLWAGLLAVRVSTTRGDLFARWCWVANQQHGSCVW